MKTVQITLSTLTFLSVLCFANGNFALGQTDSSRIALNEVIIEENRFKTSQLDQNKNVQVITKTQIDALPVRSINELLSYVAGVDLRQRGPFGAQADVSIDGGSFEQTLILVNGVKMLDAQTAHHNMNLPIPLEIIERIEVIRGAAARIYGINSLTGAINIVTQKPEKSEFLAHLRTGSNFESDTSASSTKNLYHSYGATFGGTLVKEKLGSIGLYGSHDEGNGHRYNTAFRNTKLHLNTQTAINQSLSVYAMAGYVSSDFGANGFYAAPGDKESQEIVETASTTLGLVADINQNLRINGRISHRYTYDDYRYFRHDLSKARSQHRGYALAPEINASLKTKFGDLGLGVEMRNERIRSSNIGDHERSNLGGYAEYSNNMIQNLNINVGTYVNYNSVYGWQVFPGMDLGLQLAKEWKLTSTIGSAQRIPSFTDLYLDQRPGNFGNPNLLPEEAWHMDLGVKYFGKKVIGNAYYFYRNISNFIDWVYELPGAPPYSPQNFEKNKTHGLSASAAIWISNPEDPAQWRFNLQYTWLKPTYDFQDSQLDNVVPSDMKSFQSKYVTEALRQQAVASLFYKQKRVSINIAARYQERISYKNYFLGDLRFAYHIRPFETYLDIQNILNTKYIEAAAVPMPSRWVTLGLKYHWSAN